MRKVSIGGSARASTKAARAAVIAIDGEDAGGRRSAAGLPGCIVTYSDGRPPRLTGYPGSKAAAGVVERICREMPLHDCYIELFSGFAAVFRKKRPAASSILIDASASTIKALKAWLTKAGMVARVTKCDAIDALYELPEFKSPKTLVFVDPPYIREVVTRDYYEHPFDTVDQHRLLLHKLSGLPCMVMMTHYRHPLYEELLRGKWRQTSIPAMTRGGRRTEYLWCNFGPVTAVHDTRFAGGDFRERERIKRKRARWLKRFESMGQLERQAVAQVLVECDRASVDAAMRSASPGTAINPAAPGR